MEDHLERKKLVRHALEILERYPLSAKVRQECAVALAELNGQMSREEYAKQMLAELPLTFGRENASLRQKELFQRRKQELDVESHNVRVRMWKLILELGKEDKELGIKKTAAAIAAFDRSFNIPGQKSTRT